MKGMSASISKLSQFNLPADGNFLMKLSKGIEARASVSKPNS